MTKLVFNDSWDETLNVCSIFERITGKTLHHGETDYDLTPVYEQMERDMTLVDEIIRAGGAEAEYHRSKGVAKRESVVANRQPMQAHPVPTRRQDLHCG